MKAVVYSCVCFSALLIGCQFGNAQKETPQAVKNTFKAKYPGENDPDWHVDSNGNFESNFKIDGVKLRADFSPDGTWIETEQSIDEDELPKAIRKVIKESYEHWDIAEIEKVEHHKKGVFYDVEFKKKGKNKDIEFRADGVIIN